MRVHKESIYKLRIERSTYWGEIRTAVYRDGKLQEMPTGYFEDAMDALNYQTMLQEKIESKGAKCVILGRTTCLTDSWPSTVKKN